MEKTSSSNKTRTLVLVGRTSNGKSATGNSVLGRKAFKSRASCSGVTGVCELHRTIIRDGPIINVIDTPGLFAGTDSAIKEIVKCIDMAKDGIHAILVVFSIRTRFSKEEQATFLSLQALFGHKIVDYMIVVFTGGDELEENDETLDDYIGHECPQPLKDILILCGNRKVLFDNKTKDEEKRLGQVQQLLSLVNMIISQNGGRPYTNELFIELKDNQQKVIDSMKGYSKEEMLEIKIQMQQKYDDEQKQITNMVELKLKEETTNLLKKLEEERVARLEAEENYMPIQIT
ncbi:putative PHLOEM protein 2 A3 [Spatholobus suberectus]|nr:putative PHLOEM protein 2 A3 [Spatholobus suberectus]